MSSPEPFTNVEGMTFVDDGQKPVAQMSDRELLEEIVTNMRVTAAALAAFQNGGMGKMMMSMLGSRK